MRKVAMIAAFIIVLGTLFITIKKYLGDIRPSILPSQKSIATLIQESDDQASGAQTGESVDFPLTIPQGYKIGVYTQGTNGARDLELTPAGTVLVSLQKDGKVVAVPDKNQDGVGDEVVEIITGLRNPHGLVFGRDLLASTLFVAEETSVRRYRFNEDTMSVVFEKEILRLPSGGRHVTRTLVFDKSGKLYISLGSTCDTCFEEEPWIGTVIVTDAKGRSPRIYSKGLRNAVFIAYNETRDKVWATEMGRDFLGDEDPPDEINILGDGADYGWPVCYGDKIYDRTFNQRTPAYCQNTVSPAFKIAAHSAPLGLTFIKSAQMPSDWQGDLLVAYHGSWNRSTPIGYKVVRLDVEGDRVVGESDFISGFLQGSDALGRPVDMIFDSAGSLYISDDKAGAIYKLIKNE